MPKKIAIDWDDNELRLVGAQCTGSNVTVTDAAVIPLGDKTVEQVLKAEVEARGWSKAETLAVIGRGKAELRELKLPPVPDDELPEMVRFQAIRSFASAGENAAVDYVITNRQDDGVELIAAAIEPSKLKQIRKTCEESGLTATRVVLRPLCSAALFLVKKEKSAGEVVLIDLLSDEAEIVIARDGQVVFVRTVRLPVAESARAASLAGELKRSLFASGSPDASRRVVLWGRSSVHADDVAGIAQAVGCEVETIDPFSLVNVDSKAADDMPEHVGRLAPLVGLLASDDGHADLLIDFLNPRKCPEPKSERGRKAMMIGIPAAAVLLLGGLVYRQMSALDAEIEVLETANLSLTERVTKAEDGVVRTAMVDEFLDTNVNWLSEIQRLAAKLPSSEKLIVRQIGARIDEKGGGKITVSGGITQSSIINDLQTSLRDESHGVSRGGGTRKTSGISDYPWTFKEEITVTGGSIHETRYAAFLEMTNARIKANQANRDSAETPDESPESDDSESDASADAPSPDGDSSNGDGDNPDADDSDAEDSTLSTTLNQTERNNTVATEVQS